MRITIRHAKRCRLRKPRTRTHRLRQALRLLQLYQKLLQKFCAFSDHSDTPDKTG